MKKYVLMLDIRMDSDVGIGMTVFSPTYFSSDIGIINVDVGCRILPTLKGQSSEN
jgi:hypothetical protein